MKKLLLFVVANLVFIGIHAQCTVHFVSTTGTASGAGTMTDPLDISTAFLIAGDGDIIRLGNGTYTLNSPLTIPVDNLIIEGGFLTAENWSKTSLAGTTTIYRSASNPEGTVNQQRLVAIYADGRTGFELHDLTVTTANATTASGSSYGLHFANCSDYSVVRCSIAAGNGATGANGVTGAIGATGSVGGPGSSGSIDDECAGGAGGGGGNGGGTGGGIGMAGGTNPAGCTLPGGNGPNGGASSNSRAGGAGGSGGAGGEENENGGNGGQGGGVNGGANQTGGGSGGTWGDPGNPGSNGTNGLAGNVGATGSAGTAGQFLTYYTPQQAANGGNGTGGKGGVGGGGGGGQYCTFCIDGSGNGAGGGGGGGEGGQGGTGGFGGGGSFGIYLYNNGSNTNLIDSYVVSGSAGNGGTGGSGGSGGIGGIGGLGASVGTSEIGKGGNGGNGGAGGAGGAGGNGASGVSNDIRLASGTALSVSISNFNLTAQPEIKVTYETCTNNTLSFEAVTLPLGSGTAAWDFGSNAATQTSLDNPGITSFSTTGWNTIIQGVESYTSFVYISCEGYTENVSVSICEGETHTVGSSTYSTPGIYTDVLTSIITGCDSTVTTTLAVNTVNNGISQNGTVLTASASGAIYKWIDCDNGNSIIPLATSQIYTATENGDYAVIVEQNGCSDTSDCVTVNNVGLNENELLHSFTVYPNPGNGNFVIDFGQLIHEVSIDILDNAGRVIETYIAIDKDNIGLSINGTSGIYFLKISIDEIQQVVRLIKN